MHGDRASLGTRRRHEYSHEAEQHPWNLAAVAGLWCEHKLNKAFAERSTRDYLRPIPVQNPWELKYERTSSHNLQQKVFNGEASINSTINC